MAETGHARNVERFSQLISFVQGYGADYAPSNAAISVVSLQAKLTAANGGIDGVTTALAPWKTKVNDRETAYEGVRKLVTRVVNSYAASGAEKNSVEDAKSLKRKVDGARAKALPADDPGTPEDESKGNSVSQRSYTQVAEHFDNLIELLDNDPLYAPNERSPSASRDPTGKINRDEKRQQRRNRLRHASKQRPNKPRRRTLRRRHRPVRSRRPRQKIRKITLRSRFAAI